MKIKFKRFQGVLLIYLFFHLLLLQALAGEVSESATFSQKTTDLTKHLRVSVVGDTGIGERAFHPGFVAVHKALVETHPDILLHLGDFVYQPKRFPESCPEKYIQEIRKTLVRPFQFRLFVPGDNDLPPHKRKPMASGCWEEIDPLDTPFDPVLPSQPKPGTFEGTRVIGNTFFGILNSYPWQDPTSWLSPKIEEARRKGLWIILAVHEPAVTTAWFWDKRQKALKQLNALQPDLVFSGNQHSYERFYPMGVAENGHQLKVTKSNTEKYRRGNGTIHVISGGGGATLKPFADLAGIKKRTAPEEVFEALAVRALMNHFLILDITAEVLKIQTFRVCPETTGENGMNPRWKPHMPVWKRIPLECDGKPAGVSLFEKIEIQK